MGVLERPQDIFSYTTFQLQPVFAQWIQSTQVLAPRATSTSLTYGGQWFNSSVRQGSFVAYSIRNHGFCGTSISCIYSSCDDTDTSKSVLSNQPRIMSS